VPLNKGSGQKNGFIVVIKRMESTYFNIELLSEHEIIPKMEKIEAK